MTREAGPRCRPGPESDCSAVWLRSRRLQPGDRRLVDQRSHKPDLVETTLRTALDGRQPNGRRAHPSQRPRQPVQLPRHRPGLLGPGIAASMGGRGDAYDYALMETFFGTLTIEMVAAAAAVADPPGERGP